MFSKKILNQIEKICLEKPEEESCGLIVYSESSNEELLIPCRNISENKKLHFSIHPADYLYGSKMGKIKAVYHSHPKNSKSSFSEYDKINSEFHKVTYILYHIDNKQFLYYLPNNYNNKYVGRSFEYGKSDCFSLVENYYKEELGIEILKTDLIINRNENWLDNSFSIIEEMMSKNSCIFKECDKENLQKNDILFFQSRKSRVEHFGIYLENGLFLHQKRGFYSAIEELSPAYQSMIVKAIRLR